MSVNGYLINAFALGLFACSAGMVAANAVNLSVPGKRCFVMTDNQLKRQSDPSVVGGGFGVACAIFAFLLAGAVGMSNGMKNKTFFVTLAIIAAVGFAIIGSVELAFAFEPNMRCPGKTGDGDYQFSGIEILAIFWSGLTMIGLFAPLVQKYMK